MAPPEEEMVAPQLEECRVCRYSWCMSDRVSQLGFARVHLG